MVERSGLEWCIIRIQDLASGKGRIYVVNQDCTYWHHSSDHTSRKTTFRSSTWNIIIHHRICLSNSPVVFTKSQIAFRNCFNPATCLIFPLHPRTAQQVFLILSDIDMNLRLMDELIKNVLIPSLTAQPSPCKTELQLFTLSARLGGIGIVMTTENSSESFHTCLEVHY